MTTTTVLYTLWFLIPVAFLLMALWAYLERVSGKPQRQDAIAFLKQAFFILGCVVACVIIDKFALEWIAKNVFQDLAPLGFFQVLLLPLMLLVGAKVVGPTKDIRIEKAPRPSDRPTQTKPRRGAKS